MAAAPLEGARGGGPRGWGPSEQRGGHLSSHVGSEWSKLLLCSVWNVDCNLIYRKLVKNVCTLRFHVTKVFTFCNKKCVCWLIRTRLYLVSSFGLPFSLLPQLGD